MNTISKNKKIGSKIKMARIESGLTQAEFGNKVGVTSVMVSRYEAGKTSPLRKIDNISKVLGKPTEYFLTANDSENLYEEVRSLVKLLREKSPVYESHTFKTAPILTEKQVLLLSKNKVEKIPTDKEIFISPSLKSENKTLYCIKITQSFIKNSFPLGSHAIFSISKKAQPQDLCLKTLGNKLLIGKNSSTRGKYIGKIVEVIIE